MPISVRIRGSNTNSYATGTDAVFYVKGILPDFKPIGEVKGFVGGDKRNRKGGEWHYGVTPLPFSLRDSDTTSATQDFGNLEALQEVLTLYRFLFLYEVSGSVRVNKNGDPFWSNHGLPKAVVLDGDPSAVDDFAGNTNYEFELLARSLRLS